MTQINPLGSSQFYTVQSQPTTAPAPTPTEMPTQAPSGLPREGFSREENLSPEDKEKNREIAQKRGEAAQKANDEIAQMKRLSNTRMQRLKEVTARMTNERERLEQRISESRDKSYTEEDLLGKLGANSPLLKRDENGTIALERLTDKDNKAPLVTKNEDGSYDISKLTDYLLNFVRLDLTLDSNKKDFAGKTETDYMKEAFGKQGIELSTTDAKKLIRLCGFSTKKTPLSSQ